MFVRKKVAIIWYSKLEFEKMKHISIDKDDFYTFYEEWKLEAINKNIDLVSKGYKVHKINVKADDFLGWCLRNSLPVNKSSRQKYFAEILEKFERENQ